MFPYYIYSLVCEKPLASPLNYTQKAFACAASHGVLGVETLARRSRGGRSRSPKCLHLSPPPQKPSRTPAGQPFPAPPPHVGPDPGPEAGEPLASAPRPCPPGARLPAWAWC